MQRQEVAEALLSFMYYEDIILHPDGPYLSIMPPELPDYYSDRDTIIGSSSLRAMKWAVSSSIIKGRTPTTLDPNGFTTRAEIVTMLKSFKGNSELLNQ